MLRKVLKGLAALLSIVVLAGAVGLTVAHHAIRRVRPPLPAVGDVTGLVAAGDLPVRVSYINTASQAMPRAAVLDPDRDPHPNEEYVMSHPSFVLEWADGRILLIDLGMTRAGAAEFGEPLEQLGGAAPIEPHRSAAEALGQSMERVGGVIFSHLHIDHVGGIADVCARRRGALDVLMSPFQAERTNYTTRQGRRALERSGCARTVVLSGEGPLYSVSGFPGIAVAVAAGHTPDSQIVLAQVREGGELRRYAFTGDVVNHADGIRHDVPKPLLYRLLVVPEDDGRLGEARRLLRALASEAGFTLLVPHDQREIERSGIAMWSRSGEGANGGG